ncbi:MAG TPA: AraC family transcriptional regulator [Caldimonas sp.]
MLQRSCKLIAVLALAIALPIARGADPVPAARAASASATTAPSTPKSGAVAAPAASSPAMAPAASTAPAALAATAGAASAPAGPEASASMPAMVSAALTPSAPSSAPVAGTLDGRIQDVKADVIKLNRDLLVLEEELLFPANTQVALFVSMDVGTMFQLDSVQVKLDDKVVANYLYTALEVDALHRGGVQRVYLGNLKTGQHELVAFFTGKGPHDRNYRRGANVKFEKTTEAKYIELRIQDSTAKLQPEFDIKLWQ